MKFYFTTLTFLLFSFAGLSQQYSVYYYEFRDANYARLHSRTRAGFFRQDVTQEDKQYIKDQLKSFDEEVKTFRFESVLRVDNDQSVYYPLATIHNDTIENYIEYKSSELPYISRESVNRNYSTVFLNLKENKKVSNEFNYGRHFLIEDNLKPLQWKFTNETKTIHGYTCKKAVCKLKKGIPITHGEPNLADFDASTTVVWYTEDIPANMGPMGLWGVPGLILEVKNKDTHIVFIKKIASLEGAEIEPPTKGEYITRSDYNDIPIKMFNEH